MAQPMTLIKVKQNLRIKHNELDDDLRDCIDACKADLEMCGVRAEEEDQLIRNAIKLWSRAHFTDDTPKAAAYMERYNALKGSLMVDSAHRRVEQ